MEFKKTIAARQSVRAFTGEQITDEQLNTLIQAANAAPTCMGQYDRVHLTVVQNPEILRRINEAFQKAVGDPEIQVTYGAPTLIYVSGNVEDEEIIKGANAGVIMENMLLAAADMGLGAVYLFGVSQVLFADDEISALLQLPEGFRTVSAIAVGVAADPVAERPLGTDKISITNL
ncbi:MAG: nitroreductase family protein [Coprococcus sp.]